MWNLDCSDTGRKVEDPELLEAIRLTILNNMITYHPVPLLIYPNTILDHDLVRLNVILM